MTTGRGVVPSVVVMGVQGSGKSTIGSLLAERLGMPFIDADSLHSDQNRTLMAAGQALTDNERGPWLHDVGRRLEGAGPSVVMACSALKLGYRELLRDYAPDLFLVHASGGMDLIHERIMARTHEYMPQSLLKSQFDDLEVRNDDEAGITVDIQETPEQIVERILAAISGAELR